MEMLVCWTPHAQLGASPMTISRAFAKRKVEMIDCGIKGKSFEVGCARKRPGLRAITSKPNTATY